MKKIVSLFIALIAVLISIGQTPTGFSYQAILRNAGGQVLTEKTGLLRITLTSSDGNTIHYQEIHDIKSTLQGVVNIIIGNGNSKVGVLADVPWSTDQITLKTAIKIENASDYTELGVQPLQAVPYALHANNAKEIESSPTATDDDPIFVVKNKLGQIVFAVYQSGVRVFVDDGATSPKGSKGGFAIGGLSGAKESSEYFRITPDSARIYINNPGKGTKGGFAVGGISGAKSITELLSITPDSARIYINDAGKGTKGGFAIGGISGAKNSSEYLRVTPDSTRVYVDDSGKGSKGGFAVGGISGAKGSSNFFDISIDATGTITPSQNRVLWYPIKNAFIAGKVLVESPDSVGTNSFATGYESKARGVYSQAMGFRAVARGAYSTAIGKDAVAQNNNSFAFGFESKAMGVGSFALGNKSLSSGVGSFALGFEGTDSLNNLTGSTTASGDYSIAFGMGAKALKKGSLAIGTKAEANYEYSQSFGYSTKADNWYATAVGYKSKATGKFSSAFGFQATASGEASVALGKGNAVGNLSMAIGDSYAGGIKSFSMGSASVAIGHASVAMGFENSAMGEASTALGWATFANGKNSLSSGLATTANADNSTALGSWNMGLVAGAGNPIVNSDYNPILEVGNGSSSSNLKNAMTIFRNGITFVGTHDENVVNNEIENEYPYHSLVVFGRKINPSSSDKFGLYVYGESSFGGSILPATETAFLGGAAELWYGLYAKNFFSDNSNNLTFHANLIPNTNGTRNLGSATYRWNYLYLNRLNVNGTSYFNSSVGIGTSNTDTSLPLKLSSTSTNRTALAIENPSSSNTYIIQTVGSDVTNRDGNFEIWNTGLTKASLTITSGGNVGMGSEEPSQKLDVNGNARFRVIGSGAYFGVVNRMSDGTLTTATSDIRMKENVTTLKNSLKKVMNLRGVSFTWKAQPDMGLRIGLIAQEVELIFPELVFTNEVDGYKGVNYAEISAVLVEAIKEQQTFIEKQQEEITALKAKTNEIESLKAEIEALKKLFSK